MVAFYFANLAGNCDPELKDARGEALRTLLYLHEYDRMIKYLGSG